ncbi:transglutaminase family protein (plasmid) [Skermanella sp. TT6]|uniref:Transglutaminase family protein n=1 Tax=Skermanella cutis TaxID=2775420 RepID=A0ABX7BL44_9PROT|nr:transglutaminase family protein [Skermanella sp. TT6]QQP93167.1 transglutaminase family protein [Skermanella sp. TT6]
MSIHVALNHKTTYRYDRLVSLGPQIIRLRPAPHSRTPILSYSLKVTPRQHFLNWQQDPQSNYLARFVFPEPTREFMVEVDLVAEMTTINPFDFFLEPTAEKWPFDYEPWLQRELRPYLETAPVGPRLAEWLAGVRREKQNTVSFLTDLNQRLQRHITSVVRRAPEIQTPEETLTLRTGSYRDNAWLLVQILRHLGLAARFVSGYLIQLAPDQNHLNRPATGIADLHAWTEVYLPGAGWIGLDPTSGLMAAEGHIPLACTPDPSSAVPVTGMAEPAEVEFDHELSVTRIHDKPRTSGFYANAQWAAIVALGHKVDEELRAGDVRLSMAGKPTFVLTDDRNAAEWNTTATGPTKRQYATGLIERLKNRFAPGGLLHFGQGKWSPGEPLPHWAITAYWRRDGNALWANADLLAQEAVDYGFDVRSASRFLVALTRKMGIDPALVVAAYEDPWPRVRQETALPVSVDPLDSKLDDPEERARLAKGLSDSLDEPVGFALPIGRRMTRQGPVWLSSIWPLRQERLLLAPGDSPIGYRLPLGSLPWTSQADYPYHWEQDPFEPRPPLPPHQVPLGRNPLPSDGREDAQRRQVRHAMAEVRSEVPEPGESAWWVVRTALCSEARQGRLYVFMPPMNLLEDYLDLLSLVEATAIELRMPVIIEGYPPPRDPRLDNLAVTPDPGVIKVDVHSSHSWDELVRTTNDLYEDARRCGLDTEKFTTEGRHVGTGGGNHLLIGGWTPADSPFLRRPDLLRSLITYWQNHPALSYLFSGQFIGPASQAPRIDEARHDTLYELEIAFGQLEAATQDESCPPWLIDRVLRHLLTDMQGNTHRAEFAINKLYSPDTADGRLGLVEFRGFEMPPSAQMSLTEQLLVRAMIARFWRRPYRSRLRRWGTELHDRFMLPYFVWQDLIDVLTDMRNEGYPIPDQWFTPHFDFRFPVHGEVSIRGITLELRHALEPWHALGEEPGGGGTVRFIDSSIERLQVRVTGMIGQRHTVVCNGQRIPLNPTGVEGEYVAGVRYRSWQPPSSLHPTIPVHSPLVFDLLDTWSQRSIGGCTYHVADPEGRPHDTLPVSVDEAAGRRRNRFQPSGHTPGPVDVPGDRRNAEFPLTLDLRNL